MIWTLYHYIQSCGGTKVKQLDPACAEELKAILIREVKPELWTPLPPTKEIHTFFEFIDYLVQYLASIKSKNVICGGYHKNLHHVNDVLGNTNPFTNFSVNHLKSAPLWNIVYNILGDRRCAHMILNTKCFIRTAQGNVQLFGNTSPLNKTDGGRSISKRRSFQRTRRTVFVASLLPKDIDEILEQITSTPRNTKNTPKRYRSLSALIGKIVQNDCKLNYQHLFDHFELQKDTNFEAFFNNTWSVKEVTRFVLSIIGHLFPAETWGNQKNKAIAAKKIAGFIQMSHYEQVSVADLTTSFQLTAIDWLGKSRKITSRQDWSSRVNLFSHFLIWFFETVVNSILKAFWYITDSPSLFESGKVFYFPHFRWHQITQQWLKKYILSNLVRISKEQMKESLYVHKFNFGFLKLFPKAADLRLICVPSKIPWKCFDMGMSSYGTFEHFAFLQDFVTPTRTILNYLILQKHGNTQNRPICSSKVDVASAILRYRNNLLQKHSILPKIYIVKFDMKHCFDNLSHDKIFECLDELLDYGSNKVYFVRQLAEYSMSGRMKKLRTIIKDDTQLKDFNLFSLDSRNMATNSKAGQQVLVDKNKTAKFSKEELKDFVRAFVSETKMIHEDNFFERKRGIFQGFPLLSTICELVYNKLTDILHCHTDMESLILRVVDDFMVMSTLADVCSNIATLIHSKAFEQYGAFVNTDKTMIIDGTIKRKLSIEFIGLKIGTKTLDISRNAHNHFTSLQLIKSPKKVFKYLKWLFNGLLPTYSLSLEFHLKFQVLRNVEESQASVLNAFVNKYISLSKDNITIDNIAVKVFLLEILEASIMKFQNANKLNVSHIILDEEQCCLYHESNFLLNSIISKFQFLVDQSFQNVLTLETVSEWFRSLYKSK